VAATILACNPPEYLQLIIVFSSAGMAASFLIPGVLAAFWRRATATGAIAAMVAGASVTIGLYVLGSVGPERLHLDWLFGPNPDIGVPGKFKAYYLLGLDPCVWGLSSSLAAGIIGSLLSKPPDPARVALLFDAQRRDVPAPATLDLHPELRSQLET
jgi:Na+/proline symporter